MDFGAPVERDVVVIFADLRGYTSLTEGLEPREAAARAVATAGACCSGVRSSWIP